MTQGTLPLSQYQIYILEDMLSHNNSSESLLTYIKSQIANEEIYESDILNLICKATHNEDGKYALIFKSLADIKTALFKPKSSSLTPDVFKHIGFNEKNYNRMGKYGY